jgi:hypothetical protein
MNQSSMTLTEYHKGIHRATNTVTFLYLLQKVTYCNIYNIKRYCLLIVSVKEVHLQLIHYKLQTVVFH